jgi:hypothetical protein
METVNHRENLEELAERVNLWTQVFFKGQLPEIYPFLWIMILVGWIRIPTVLGMLIWIRIHEEGKNDP